jgi:hypothetical protein
LCLEILKLLIFAQIIYYYVSFSSAHLHVNFILSSSGLNSLLALNSIDVKNLNIQKKINRYICCPWQPNLNFNNMHTKLPTPPIFERELVTLTHLFLILYYSPSKFDFIKYFFKVSLNLFGMAT